MPLGESNLPALLPPTNIEAEQGLLAALLMRSSTHEAIAGTLRAEHFSDEVNGKLFAAIEREIDAGRRISPITLSGEFDKAYLAQLAVSAVTLSNNREYARVIVETWQRRELLALAADVRGLVEAPTVPVEELREAIDGRLSDIFIGADARDLTALADSIHPTLARIEDAWRNRGKLMGVTTGLADLDRHTGGLMPGELYILAGRPGMGKSSCAKTMALAAARSGATVGFFSLEMSAEMLTQWCLADPTGISATRQRIGGIDENDISRLVDAAADLRDLPLFIDDRSALTMGQIRGRARLLQRRHGLGLVVVDHIGLVRASNDARRFGAVKELTEITNDLKRLAKDLGVPVLALSQLNRAVEARDDKRPGLSDLRDSGSVEQDADAVIFAYREEYYLRDEPEQKSGESEEKFQKRKNEWHERMDRCKGLADLIIAKQRSGPLQTVRVRFEPEHCRMSNWARY